MTEASIHAHLRISAAGHDAGSHSALPANAPEGPRGHAVRHSFATLPTPNLNLVIDTRLPGTGRWTGTPVIVASDRCKGCELCVAACPKHALELDAGTVNPLGHHPVRLVAPASCTSCAFCAKVCPDAVLTVLAAPKDGVR